MFSQYFSRAIVGEILLSLGNYSRCHFLLILRSVGVCGYFSYAYKTRQACTARQHCDLGKTDASNLFGDQ